MKRKIDSKPYVIDVMEEIAKERKRLEKIVSRPEYKKHPQWSWMEDWLAKSDEEHYEEMKSFDINVWCDICGKKGRFFLAMDFSFCDEYDCGIQICGECLSKMKKTFTHDMKVRSQNEK